MKSSKKILNNYKNKYKETTYFNRSKIEIGKEICGRYPGVHHWEHFDSRLLVCEIYALPNSNIAKKNAEVKDHFKQTQQASAASKTNFSFAQQFNSINTNQQLKPNLEQETENLNKSAECLVVSIFSQFLHFPLSSSPIRNSLFLLYIILCKILYDASLFVTELIFFKFANGLYDISKFSLYFRFIVSTLVTLVINFTI